MSLSSIAEEVWTEIKTWFDGTVVPDAEKAAAAVEAVALTWAKQFETDFGAKALAEAITAVAAFAAGGFPTVPAIAAQVGAALLAQGVATAEADAQTVILNAARTALNAATATTSAAAPTATPETPDTTPAEPSDAVPSA